MNHNKIRDAAHEIGKEFAERLCVPYTAAMQNVLFDKLNELGSLIEFEAWCEKATALEYNVARLVLLTRLDREWNEEEQPATRSFWQRLWGES